ncbi:TetR/AcrR family transcriptional regulator [Solimonas marina]|uniref:TetR/AcrR family transcriptional regulator n=1 Tax=Solimonas marina TaxID=2714601 RepID=A0A969WA85_9GAMM|nr:TetR/AcrR family transcriptional regulator [Solimonas marina]NKF23651.1 TetR/AcrR family transcriptional regulator [Solimonas marina]
MSAHSATAQAILQSAHTLIVDGGYNGFSYADISKVVGIRNASIHHHFPSKVDLVCALVADYRHDAEAGIAALERTAPEPSAALRAYVGYWEACITDASAPFCLCALLAAQLPVLPEPVAFEVRAHFRALSAWLVSVLERGAKHGDIHLGGSAKTEAETFMATVHGAMLSARAYGDAQIFGVITQPLLDRLIAH